MNWRRYSITIMKGNPPPSREGPPILDPQGPVDQEQRGSPFNERGCLPEPALPNEDSATGGASDSDSAQEEVGSSSNEAPESETPAGTESSSSEEISTVTDNLLDPTPAPEIPPPPSAWNELKRKTQGRIDMMFGPQTSPLVQTDVQSREASLSPPQIIREVVVSTENPPPQAPKKGRRRIFLQGASDRIKGIWERHQLEEPPQPTAPTDKPIAQGPAKRRRRTKKEMVEAKVKESKVLAKKKEAMKIWRERKPQARQTGEAEAEAEAEVEEHDPLEEVSGRD
jgi:hypothetical protein